jgi:hypothetical protein
VRDDPAKKRRRQTPPVCESLRLARGRVEAMVPAIAAHRDRGHLELKRPNVSVQRQAPKEAPQRGDRRRLSAATLCWAYPFLTSNPLPTR